MADGPASPKQEESATTRQELDFDDSEHEQESGNTAGAGQLNKDKPPPTNEPSSKSGALQTPKDEEAPPAKPPRPTDPQQQAENTLIEAFPSIDTKVVKAVLMASGGKVEPAFNALLGMSDPSFKPEDVTPPQQPTRPTAHRGPRDQLEADELYARQLAEHFNTTQGRGHNYNQREASRRGPNRQPRPGSSDSEDDRNFFDDDLPEIGRNIQQGFFDTQKKVNSWITNFRKRIDGEDEDDDLYDSSQPSSRQNTGPGRQNFGPSQTEQMHGIRRQAAATADSRRSTEATRYDADPRELDEAEFQRLELHDDEAPPAQPPRTSSRKSPNPDLFKPQPRPPQPGPVDEVDAADRTAGSAAGSGNTGEVEKSKKWQPLTSLTPAPEEDNDPFSVGDDDEGETNRGEDLRKADTERLKEAARGSVSEGAGVGEKKLEASEKSGSKDKTAEELLSGNK